MLRKTIIAGLMLCPLFTSAEPVDINKADAVTLEEAIKGVGQNKAEAIVAYRETHGAFESVDELVLVQGIGEKTVEKNRENLIVSPNASH